MHSIDHIGTGSSDGESDVDIMRVRFEDSEDKRTTAMNDGIEVIEVDWLKASINKVEVNGKSYKYKICVGSKGPKKRLIPKKKKFHVVIPAGIAKAAKTKDSERMDKEKDQYVSDELGSSNPDASENENFPKCEKFIKE